MELSDVGPLIEVGGQLIGALAIIFIGLRWLSSAQTTAVATLQGAAEDARKESLELRQELDELKEKSDQQGDEIAKLKIKEAEYLIEQGRLEHKITLQDNEIAQLKRHVADLEAQLKER